MRTGFPFLSRFLSRLIEIVGAGIASAAGAFLLGHIATPAAPPPVVQIVPADAETIRMVRGDRILADQLRKDELRKDELRKDIAPASGPAVGPAPESMPATASAKVAKAARAVHALPARREHKAEAGRVGTGTAARGPQLPVRITPAGLGVEQQTALAPAAEVAEVSRPLPMPDQASGGGGFRLFAALRQIPGWFLPSLDGPSGDVPRPPLPVGQFWQSTM